MYSYLTKLTIKFSSTLSFIFIVLVGYFLQFATSSASVFPPSPATTSSEPFVVNATHVERSLSYGMSGNDVKDLQEQLRALPSIYPSGKVTGYFGAATQAAVKRFQKQEKINNHSESTTTVRGVMDTHAQLTLHLRVTEKKCRQNVSRSRQKCLEETYEHYAHRLGVDKTLRILRLQISDEPLFAGVCHGVMHHIAHVATHEFKNFGSAMYHGTTLCQNGYYHGVVEEYLRNENVDTLTADDLRNFCVTSLKATSTATDILNCVHGVGHALMYMTRNDLPKSLLRCGDILRDDMRIQCLTGAFMQESFIATSTDKSALDKQILGCSQSNGDQGVCWISLSARVVCKNTTNTMVVDQFCATFENIINRDACKTELCRG